MQDSKKKKHFIITFQIECSTQHFKKVFFLLTRYFVLSIHHFYSECHFQNEFYDNQTGILQTVLKILLRNLIPNRYSYQEAKIYENFSSKTKTKFQLFKKWCVLKETKIIILKKSTIIKRFGWILKLEHTYQFYFNTVVRKNHKSKGELRCRLTYLMNIML